MAANKLDLDIEFEDEDEIKRLEEERKKREEVKEVNLEFSVEPDEEDGVDIGASSGAALKKAQAEARRAALEMKNTPSSKSEDSSNVSNIEAARQAKAPVRDQTQTNPNISEASINKPSSRPSASSPQYRLGDELNYAIESNALLNAEIQARIQLAVSQAKTEIIAKAAQESKLLEHKVVKLLTQVHAKAPGAKAELMAIKKMLAEHAEAKVLIESNEPQVEQVAAPVKKKSSAS